MTANSVLIQFMRYSFEVMEEAGCFRSTTVAPVPAAYAKALAAQQAKKKELEQ